LYDLAVHGIGPDFVHLGAIRGPRPLACEHDAGQKFGSERLRARIYKPWACEEFSQAERAPDAPHDTQDPTHTYKTPRDP